MPSDFPAERHPMINIVITTEFLVVLFVLLRVFHVI
jgi:hypothetical protein